MTKLYRVLLENKNLTLKLKADFGRVVRLVDYDHALPDCCLSYSLQRK